VFQRKYELVEGLTLEEIGGEYVALLPEKGVTLRIDPSASRVLRAIVEGDDVHVHGQESLRSLLDNGVIIETTSGITRRGIVCTATLGAVSGVAVLSLPSVAAASSESAIEILGEIIFAPSDEGKPPAGVPEFFALDDDVFGDNNDDDWFLVIMIDPDSPAVLEAGLSAEVTVTNLVGGPFPAGLFDSGGGDLVWVVYVGASDPNPSLGEGNPFVMTFTDKDGVRFRVTEGLLTGSL
jgi:hypothetical protein